MAAHVGFSIWVKFQRPSAKTGLELHTMFPELAGTLYEALKPDAVDPQHKDYFELKPVRHADRPDLQALDAAQMIGYDFVLGIGYGYHRGDSWQLVQASPGFPAVGQNGVLIGELILPRSTWTLTIWPADDPMSGGFSGKGFVWYEVKQQERRHQFDSVPATEELKVYAGEPVRVRVWEPRFSPWAQALVGVGVYTGVAVAAYTWGPAILVQMANLLGLQAALGATR
jgi:hypothetical protein